MKKVFFAEGWRSGWAQGFSWPRRVKLFRRCALIGVVVVGFGLPAFACGPNFPNSLLDGGDAALLTAPDANFAMELARLPSLAAKFKASITTNDYATETIEGELADLRKALKVADASTAEAADIVYRYRIEREKLRKFRQATDAWSAGHYQEADGKMVRKKSDSPPSLDRFNVQVIAGLPPEFADYFRGGIAWHTERTNAARSHWEQLLQRPAAERKYRSTWAAYMLGKSWEEENPDQAIVYFQQVRALAAQGFADRLGLAAASLGWEARLNLEQKNFEAAIELYLQQLASGDDSAIISLSWTAAKIVGQKPRNFGPLALNPHTRWVVSSYLISHKDYLDYRNAEGDPINSTGSIILDWLDAVETAGVKDVESAEQIALAAYQAGEWTAAERWIRIAKSTPTTQWLQAKLLLRAGKSEAAAELLAKLTRLFPVDLTNTNPPSHRGLQDSLRIGGSSYLTNEINVPSQMLAELGAMQLSRREYTESLDALLRAGFWMDAAYVAERVLSVNELKTYVDRNWPNLPSPQKIHSPTNAAMDADPVETVEDYGWSQIDLRSEIRHLLARRLVRLERLNEAREYFPKKWQPDFTLLTQNIFAGRSRSTPVHQQAEALFIAAQIMREQGMDLLGTEVEPDWRVHGGSFEEGVSLSQRAAFTTNATLTASEDEITRAQANHPAPDQRFHYRYRAASFAWAAAALLPNNSDELAQVLCIGGTWLKNRDPDTADLFYKALVRRCRKTAIGALADRMRWFPELDTNGMPIPWQPNPPVQLTAAEVATNSFLPTDLGAGFWYCLNRGNVLEDVIEAVQAEHQLSVTAEDLLQANAGINTNQLGAGQNIFVPFSPPAHPLEPMPGPAERLPEETTSPLLPEQR
jgi:hypothetical protein